MRTLCCFILILTLGMSGCGQEPQEAEEIRSEERGAERCLHKTCFSEFVHRGGERFRMTGISSLVKYIRFVVYVAAFYLPDREGGIEVSPGHDAKILAIRYHRDLEKEQVIDSLRRDLNSMKDIRMDELRERFVLLEDAFEPSVKGDRYEFIFIPGGGTAMVRNGRTLAVIPGDDFAYAFFGIWISPDVEDQRMRKELLGPAAFYTGPLRKEGAEGKGGVSGIGAVVRETSRKVVRGTVNAVKKLNPVPLGKRAWRWISRQS
jgi:hypothetical protein